MHWLNVARLVHPLALARFRSFQLERAREGERRRGGEDAAWREPGMPDEVAAWFEERRKRHEADHGPRLSHDFARIGTVAELEGLSAEEMLARWLEAADPRTMLRRAAEAAGRDLPGEVTDGPLLQLREVIGGVREDESTVQVVYSTRIGHSGNAVASDVRIAVATVRRCEDGEWRLWSTWQDHALFDSFQMGISFESRDERLAELASSQHVPFRWPADGTPLLSASIVGYAGNGLRPEGIAIEVRSAAGAPRSVVVPAAALPELVRYLEPWMYLPEQE